MNETQKPVLQRALSSAITFLGVVLCLFTLFEVNFSQLQTQSAKAVFVMLGLVLCFLAYPLHPKFKNNVPLRTVDILLALGVVVTCGYVVLQTEPYFKEHWSSGISLASRAGAETEVDFYIGLAGLILVFEATRRAIGMIVPALAFAFVLHSYYCYGSQAYGWAQLPGWLLPHSGQSLKDIASTTFLQTLGVFGPASGVMFKYVFLFVVFGAFLEMSGATRFIIDFAERVFGNSRGGPAKVSVLGSGLMGSLSGSAVANAVTTGSFTIPMMRNTGFERHVAGGITAAAASGGALVPPVMGAGAYMMIELVKPDVTFIEIATAAVIPAVLYYLSIFLIVHFYAHRVGISASIEEQQVRKSLSPFEATVFFSALGVLVGLLGFGFTPFRAVTGSLVVILVLSPLRPQLQMSTLPRMLSIGSFVAAMLVYQFNFVQTVDDPTAGQIFESWLESAIVGMFGLLVFGLFHPEWRPRVIEAFTKSAKNGISLVAASACVGIIIGIVQQTGIASDFSSNIKDVVHSNLLVALLGIMACSIVLGMGVPSVVCYLLMATLMGSMLSDMGVIPLAAHLFIFYFGMMSMVTPPVALAAYASASIAEAKIMPTAFAAFRFSLVGFTLPFMFIYRPELLLLSAAPEVVALKTDATAAEAAANVEGQIIRYGKPVQNRELTFTAENDSGKTVSATTESTGAFQVEVEPGRWILTLPSDKGETLHIGVLDFDPTRVADTVPTGKSDDPGAEMDEEKPVDARLQFDDQRLSWWAVFIAVGSATIGIVALAAGVAGYFRTEIRLPVRVGMLTAAALLLSPDVTVAGEEIGLYTNIAGGALFLVTGGVNWLRSLRQRSETAPPETSSASSP